MGTAAKTSAWQHKLAYSRRGNQRVYQSLEENWDSAQQISDTSSMVWSYSEDVKLSSTCLLPNSLKQAWPSPWSNNSSERCSAERHHLDNSTQESLYEIPTLVANLLLCIESLALPHKPPFRWCWTAALSVEFKNTDLNPNSQQNPYPSISNNIVCQYLLIFIQLIKHNGVLLVTLFHTNA